MSATDSGQFFNLGIIFSRFRQLSITGSIIQCHFIISGCSLKYWTEYGRVPVNPHSIENHQNTVLFDAVHRFPGRSERIFLSALS